MQAVSFVVYWLVVPLIFLRLLSFANEIKDFEKEGKQKWSAREESARVGFWAGILIAVVCISWQMSEGHNSFKPPMFNPINIVAGIGISWIGILVIWPISRLIQWLISKIKSPLSWLISKIKSPLHIQGFVTKIKSWLSNFLNLIQRAKFGILALFLSAISVLGLFSYIFIDSCRDLIFKVTLASAIDILLFLVFFPETLEDLKKP